MKHLALAIATALIVTSTSAHADVRTFTLEWSPGGSAPGTGSASGFITLDLSLLTNPGTNLIEVGTPDPVVLDFSITVTGATGGNGTWGLSSFDEFYFDSGDALDFSSELVGQPHGNGIWGDVSEFGSTFQVMDDFNFYAINPPGGTPLGSDYFTITVGGDGAPTETLRLTSFRPIPEPASASLILAAGMACLMRRRRAQG